MMKPIGETDKTLPFWKSEHHSFVARMWFCDVMMKEAGSQQLMYISKYHTYRTYENVDDANEHRYVCTYVVYA
jgi:hypothetical protein